MWGALDAVYTPQPVAGRDALVAAHREEVAARLPLRPLSSIAAEHPGIDPARFAIGAAPARTVSGDRKSVVSGKRVSVSVDLGGRRIIKKKNKYKYNRITKINTGQTHYNTQ